MEPAENVEQQSLLPEFEGARPSGADLSFVGTTQLDESSEPSRYGERVFYLIEGEVSGVAHKRKNNVGMVRRHTVDVEHAYKLDELQAKQVLKEIEDGQRSLQVSHRHRNDPSDEDGE